MATTRRGFFGRLAAVLGGGAAVAAAKSLPAIAAPVVESITITNAAHPYLETRVTLSTSVCDAGIELGDAVFFTG